MARARPAAKVQTLPAPFGGWDTKSAITNMPPENAVVLDNWVPSTEGVVLRTGYDSWATGLPAAVESLMEYNSTSGISTLFAASGANIYNVTAQGAVGAAVQSSLTSARWQHTMFATSGGNFLFIVNGSDAPRYYNGSTWTTPSITGATAANFVTVTAHQQRLWFVEKNTLKAWYLPVSSVAGAATAFDFGPLCRKGGFLVNMFTWTRDGGAGPDDLAVFITSRGEVLVYSGTDPASASTWALEGVFSIPTPIGRRCGVKVGADVGLITSGGLLPLSQILPLAISGAAKVAATDMIQSAFNDSFNAYKDNFGWQVIEHPAKQWMIVNVPATPNALSYQFVMHSLTGAWCRFTNINANCWSLSGDTMYFGANGIVYRMGSDYNDNGNPVQGYMLTAFQKYGTPGFKRFTMARPLLYGVPGASIPVRVKVDYDTTTPAFTPTTISSTGSPWDTSPWDTSPWDAGVSPTARWQSINGIGQVGAIAIAISSLNSVQLNSIDIMYEPGGVF